MTYHITKGDLEAALAMLRRELPGQDLAIEDIGCGRLALVSNGGARTLVRGLTKRDLYDRIQDIALGARLAKGERC